MSAIRRLVLCAVTLVSLSLSGCATLIEAAIPERETHSLGGAPQVLSVPRGSIQHSTAPYESPIPKWNSAYRGAGENLAVQRRVATALDIADIVRDMAANLPIIGMSGGRANYVHLTPLAISFCIAGVPQNHDKNWWGNAYSLQPGGLALAVAEEQVRRKCETSYRRSHE